MGTRSITTIIDEYSGKEVVSMYRQFDGYLEGHGMELADFLNNFVVVNGLPIGKEGLMANGMGCLGAQVVEHFKDGAGGIYLMVPNEGQTEEYNYRVTLDTVTPRMRKHDGIGQLNIEVTDWTGKVLFSGSPSDLLATGGVLPLDTDTCQECGREFKHYLHAKNHYAARHDLELV